MKELDLDIAADYIYFAAVLVHIKSRCLLPRDEAAGEAEDPRSELVARLLEYEKFKRAAESFHEIDTLRAGLWERPANPPQPSAHQGLPPPDVPPPHPLP